MLIIFTFYFFIRESQEFGKDGVMKKVSFSSKNKNTYIYMYRF